MTFLFAKEKASETVFLFLTPSSFLYAIIEWNHLNVNTFFKNVKKLLQSSEIGRFLYHCVYPFAYPIPDFFLADLLCHGKYRNRPAVSSLLSPEKLRKFQIVHIWQLPVHQDGIKISRRISAGIF